jgi:hypothetical protein
MTSAQPLLVEDGTDGTIDSAAEETKHEGIRMPTRTGILRIVLIVTCSFLLADCQVNLSGAGSRGAAERRLTQMQAITIADESLKGEYGELVSNKYSRTGASFSADDGKWYIIYDLKTRRGNHGQLTVTIEDKTRHPEIWLP